MRSSNVTVPAPGASMKEIEEAFIKVSFQELGTGESSKGTDPLYDEWMDKASGKRSAPELYGTNALRSLYPKHSLLLLDQGVNILSYPGASVQPLAPSELLKEMLFIPMARRSAAGPGMLADRVWFGSFAVAWNAYEFVVYVAKWRAGYSTITQQFLLHEGPEEPIRELVLSAGIWQQEVHEEIWVFNQGYWRKESGLWAEIQKADWNDVILKEEFKNSLQKDIYGFFTSEALYKELAIPWKRGLIMYGPPGNGKTISIKVIMKTCEEKGYLPLYVKSFQSFQGEEASMAMVFDKARQLSPCVIVMEDLDSLINSSNRSFFLNQIDGLEGNDGLLIIGTTNHVEQLDPALSERPSRFDRKYLFEDPDRDERALYCKYWQKKLAKNPNIDFSDDLLDDVAGMTERFSFAYLKEAFVSTLVLLATDEKHDESDFATVLKEQIGILRKELDKTPKLQGTPVNHACAPSQILLDPSSPQAQNMQGQELPKIRLMAAAAATLGRSFMF